MAREERVEIRLTKEEKEKLKRLAEKDNRSMSEWVENKIKKSK